MRMVIKRSLMPTGDSVNDGSREERTTKPTPWMRGEPGGRPFLKKVYPLPLLSEILHQRDGFHWVQLCRCCSDGVQPQSKQYVPVVGYCSFLTDRSTSRKQTVTKFVNSRYFNSTSPQTWPTNASTKRDLAKIMKPSLMLWGPYVLYYK